jgi:hypothetical protein
MHFMLYSDIYTHRYLQFSWGWGLSRVSSTIRRVVMGSWSVSYAGQWMGSLGLYVDVGGVVRLDRWGEGSRRRTFLESVGVYCAA